MRRIIAGLSFFLMLAALGTAQNFRGGISGIVTDQSGAVIGSATVRATDEGTGLVYTTESSSAGEFAFQDLPLGDYSVTVTQNGFETQKVNGIHVSAGAIYNLPVKLSVAQVSSTVEVSAAAVSLDTTSSTLTNVVPTKTVQDLPVNGRDFTQMIALSPGFAGYAAGAHGSYNGARSNQFNWQIEGSDNNDQWFNIMAVNQGGINSISGVILPLDALDEFSAQNQAGVETGRNPGATVNLIIKSGTNQLHGSVYYYNRNEFLAAQSPFAPPGSPKNELRNQHYGFSLGGPIRKDKTFYFITYEDQKFVIGNQSLATEPSTAYQTAALQLLKQYNVPVNPVSQTLLNTLWPASSLTGPAAADNYFDPIPQTGVSHNGLAKIDHSFNDNNRLSFRWFVGQGTQTAPVGSFIPYYYQVGPMHVQNFSLIFNSILSPSITNEAVAGVNYFHQSFSDANSSFNPVALGFNTGVSAPDLSGAPMLAITGFDSTGLSPASGRQDFTGHMSDVVSYIRGKHQIRFGGEVRRVQIYEIGAGGGNNDGGRGNFFFNGTQGPWSGLLSQPGFDTNIAALADFMAGYVYQSNIESGNVNRDVNENIFNLFVGDSVQVTRTLNVNFGLRWDYEGPLYSGQQDLSVFDPSVPGGLAVVGQQVSNLYPQDWKLFSPRVGLAYQPTALPGVVIRAGFGLYYDTPATSPFLDQSSLTNNGAIGVNANPAGTRPVYDITRNSYTIVPGQAIFPTSISLSGDNVINLFSVNPNFRPAGVLNYNFNVEKSLGTHTVLQVGYVGSQARHLNIVTDINQAALGSGFIPGTDAAGFTYQQQSRPYFSQFPNFGVIDQLESAGDSNFNSLQTSLRTSSWHGLISQVSYTWGHNLDDLSNATSLPQNSYNLRADYGNASLDIRHQFKAYFVYDIPGSSRGPHWLSHGWQANSNIYIRTGEPVNIRASSDNSGTGENSERANQVADPFQGVSHAFTVGSPVQWFSQSSFINPSTGSFGTVARDSLYGPGFASVDLSIFREFPIKERLRAQFRVEMFNIFNRVNLAPPGSRVGGGLGKSGDTIGDYSGSPGIGPGEPFNTQLALKFLF